MSNETAITPSIGAFIKRRLISEVLETIKSGKEASVYRCRAHPDTGRRWIAAKIHRPVHLRAFKHDGIYQDTRLARDVHAASAFAESSGFGGTVPSGTWARAEFETLRLLHARGCAVPEPLAIDGRTILMEWIGDDDPAPPLRSVRLEQTEARGCLSALLGEIRLWLAHHRVHGDLSAFNILHHDGAPVAIDFPQAVDPRTNPNARELLARDLRNLGVYFARYGLAFDEEGTLADWWRRWERAEL